MFQSFVQNVSPVSRSMLQSFWSGFYSSILLHMLQVIQKHVVNICSKCFTYFIDYVTIIVIWMFYMLHTNVTIICSKCFNCFSLMLRQVVPALLFGWGRADGQGTGRAAHPRASERGRWGWITRGDGGGRTRVLRSTGHARCMLIHAWGGAEGGHDWAERVSGRALDIR
jgi:hypothetical protein